MLLMNEGLSAVQCRVRYYINDETNSFPKYLYRGLDECLNTLTGDNLIFELCEKIRDLRKMSGDFIYD